MICKIIRSTSKNINKTETKCADMNINNTNVQENSE